jgi:hypothetical protein
MTIDSRVADTSFMSWRLAPSTAMPMGIPSPSVSRDRLTPSLPRSVGLRPVASPPQGGLGHGPVHGLPFPVNALQGVGLQQTLPPQPLKYPSLPPELEAVMDGAGGAKLPGEGLLLTAGAQDVEDAVQQLPVRLPGASAMGMGGFGWQQGLNAGPQILRNAPAVVNSGLLTSHAPITSQPDVMHRILQLLCYRIGT